MGICNSTKSDENHNKIKNQKFTLKKTSTIVKGEMFFGKKNRLEY